MPEIAIMDWDDAYANTIHIPGGESFPPLWLSRAAMFRDRMKPAGRCRLDIAYGSHPRHRYDLFLPEGRSKGLAVFVHGGYWRAFDKSSWSHLAEGPVTRGFAVAVPSYTLCPEASIAEIGRQIANAIAHGAGMVDGPLFLSGHSAGGQLVTRLVAGSSPLSGDVRTRIKKIVSISGLHDLRPLLKTKMNSTLRLNPAMAAEESPALREPQADTDVVCWVGAEERPEFIRQSELLANIWRGLGARTGVVRESLKHHFDVVEGLSDPAHPLVEALLGGTA